MFQWTGRLDIRFFGEISGVTGDCDVHLIAALFVSLCVFVFTEKDPGKPDPETGSLFFACLPT